MSTIRTIFMAMAAFLLFQGTAAAQGAPASTAPCTGDDFKGTYVLVYFHEDPPGKESKWRSHFDHEYMSISGKYPFLSDVTINKELDAEQAKKSLSQPVNFRKYTLGPNGALQIYNDKNIAYSFTCTVSRVSDGSFQKGDLIWEGRTQGEGHSLYRLYRHWYE